MTKRREPLTYQATLTKVADRIGWDNAGAICGVSERACRNWSEPDTQSQIRMIDAERLDRAYLADGGSPAPFHHLLGLRLDISDQHAAALCVSRSAAAAAKETGEAVAALVMAGNSDGCRDAIRKARTEAQEAIVALTESLAALDRFETAGAGS